MPVTQFTASTPVLLNPGVFATTLTCEMQGLCQMPCNGVMYLHIPVAYLLTNSPSHGHGERTHVATAQVLTFPLVTEELQFALFLIVQTVTVTYLNKQRKARDVKATTSMIIILWM